MHVRRTINRLFHEFLHHSWLAAKNGFASKKFWQIVMPQSLVFAIVSQNERKCQLSLLCSAKRLCTYLRVFDWTPISASSRTWRSSSAAVARQKLPAAKIVATSRSQAPETVRPSLATVLPRAHRKRLSPSRQSSHCIRSALTYCY